MNLERELPDADETEPGAVSTEDVAGTELAANEDPEHVAGSEPSPGEEAGAASDDPREDEPADEVSVDATIEAVLFSSEIPLTAQRLGQLAGGGKRVALEVIDRLNVAYGESGRAFRITPIAGGYQLVTNPEHAGILAKLHRERVPTRLSPAALETLSIIAFKQPVTRAEIDTIRGVSASDRVLRNLIDRKLVRISGRAEAPGRPLLYGTTREFLAYFGLSAVSDLPRTAELNSLLAGDVPEPSRADQEVLGLEDLDVDLESRPTSPPVIMEEDEARDEEHLADDEIEPLSHSERESDERDREGLTET